MDEPEGQAEGGADVVVLRGRPDDAELAALLAVLALLRAEAPGRENLLPPPAPRWTRPARYRAAGAWTTR
ncbi:hypothetical protein GCM10009609_18810 [Pseudonocardia aurantiaca]|uniref:Acyl-CoA carboxylase epsilon subunit n=1 Tax=Pseudonocardia aurantiaca TaxID=75290 RepID=A0ABW4FMM1_9PSEU